MFDLLIQTGLSNAVIAMLIAILAMVVGWKARRPQLAHLLWMLVLVKLITPPLFTVPVDFVAAKPLMPALNSFESSSFADNASSNVEVGLVLEATNKTDELVHPLTPEVEIQPGAQSSQFASVSATWTVLKPWLGAIWFGGTLLIVCWSLFRVAQFSRMLRQNSHDADKRITSVAKRLGGRLGLRKLPRIATTSARLSPMVWWVGGRVQVVLPHSMLGEMEVEQWQWVLAHELAHVRRGDYFVRWLEWLACACFWWNPIVWWAQRNLRVAEEICCDELVMSSFNPSSHSYAESILAAVESLVCPAIRPPAMASEINSGGFLERRIEMILSGTQLKGSRGFHFCIVAMAVIFIPLGMGQAQDSDAVKKRLRKSVKKGELSFQQADHMMSALAGNSFEYQSLREANVEAEYERHDWYEDNEWFEGQELEMPTFNMLSKDDALRTKFLAAEDVLIQMHRAGKITAKDVETQLAAFKKRLKQDGEANQLVDHKREKYESAKTSVANAVAEGELTEKQGKAKLAALSKRLWPDHSAAISRARNAKRREIENRFVEEVQLEDNRNFERKLRWRIELDKKGGGKVKRNAQLEEGRTKNANKFRRELLIEESGKKETDFTEELLLEDKSLELDFVEERRSGKLEAGQSAKMNADELAELLLREMEIRVLRARALAEKLLPANAPLAIETVDVMLPIVSESELSDADKKRLTKILIRDLAELEARADQRNLEEDRRDAEGDKREFIEEEMEVDKRNLEEDLRNAERDLENEFDERFEEFENLN